MKISNKPNKNFHILPNQRLRTSSKLDLKERGLLSAILEFASIDSWALNLNHLAKECDCSVATIQKLIRSLISKGWVSRERVYSPKGVQGSFCRYEINLSPEEADKVTSKKSKQRIVGEYFSEKDSSQDIQAKKITEHNKTNSNKTESKKTKGEKLNSNHTNKIINLQEEIREKVNNLMWTTIEELEDFHAQFTINKAKMMNKLPGEVEGIYKKLEERINEGNPNMSDLNALKQWREGFFKETNFIPKQKIKAGFSTFTQENQYKPEELNDFVQNIKKEDSNTTQNTKGEENMGSIYEENLIQEMIEKAIAQKEIICERFNSEGKRGIQIDNFTFEELDNWIENKLTKEDKNELRQSN